MNSTDSVVNPRVNQLSRYPKYCSQVVTCDYGNSVCVICNAMVGGAADFSNVPSELGHCHLLFIIQL